MKRLGRLVSSAVVSAFAISAIGSTALAQDSAVPELRMRTTITSGQSASTSVTSQMVSADTHPAVWKVADADTTVYLFGTVHVLKPGTKWRSPAFNDAFMAADTIYFEAKTSGNAQADLAQAVQTYGMNPAGRSLSDFLTARQKEVVDNAARAVGFHPLGLEPMRPWFAGINLGLAAIIAEGHDPESGVESQMEPAAKRAGKKLRYFETAEEQIRFFADLPDPVQVQFLVQGAEEIEEAAGMLDKLDDAWLDGDMRLLEELLIDDMRDEAPEVYDAIIKRRNHAWADDINELMLQEDGVFLVAVGAAHFAGPDSVNVLLEGLGHTIERQ